MRGRGEENCGMIYMSNGGSGVKILETHVEPRTTAKLT